MHEVSNSMELEDMPPSFICPITNEMMRDPGEMRMRSDSQSSDRLAVSTCDGHSYERSAIEDWLQKHNTSPVTNLQLESTILIPVHALRNSIEEWCQKKVRSVLKLSDLRMEEAAFHSNCTKEIFRAETKKSGLPSSVAVLKLSRNTKLKEANLFMKISHHPCIVNFFGLCCEESERYLVTEYSNFGSVNDAMERFEDDFTLDHKLVIIQQACMGMCFLSDSQLLHGNLQARNILLFEFDKQDHSKTVAKLSDCLYPLAQYDDANFSSDYHRRVRYLPPETLMKRRFTTKSDVWAFAVTTWEIASGGMLPYWELADEAEVKRKVSQGYRLERPQELDDQREGLWKLLRDSWDVNPKARPSFQDVLSVVSVGGETAVEGENPQPIKATEASKGGAPESPQRKRQLSAALGDDGGEGSSIGQPPAKVAKAEEQAISSDASRGSNAFQDVQSSSRGGGDNLQLEVSGRVTYFAVTNEAFMESVDGKVILGFIPSVLWQSQCPSLAINDVVKAVAVPLMNNPKQYEIVQIVDVKKGSKEQAVISPLLKDTCVRNEKVEASTAGTSTTLSSFLQGESLSVQQSRSPLVSRPEDLSLPMSSFPILTRTAKPTRLADQIDHEMKESYSGLKEEVSTSSPKPTEGWRQAADNDAYDPVAAFESDPREEENRRSAPSSSRQSPHRAAAPIQDVNAQPSYPNMREDSMSKMRVLAEFARYGCAKDYKTVVSMRDEVVSIARKIDTDQPKLAMVIFKGLGEAYFSLEDYRNSLEMHYEQLDIAEKVGDDENKKIAYKCMHRAYVLLQDSKMQEKTLKKLLEVCHASVDVQTEVETLRELEGLYISTKDRFNLIETLSKLLRIHTETQMVEAEKRVRAHLLSLKLEVETELERKSSSSEESSKRYLDYGNILHALGQFEEAVEIYRKFVRSDQTTASSSRDPARQEGSRSWEKQERRGRPESSSYGGERRRSNDPKDGGSDDSERLKINQNLTHRFTGTILTILKNSAILESEYDASKIEIPYDLFKQSTTYVRIGSRLTVEARRFPRKDTETTFLATAILDDGSRAADSGHGRRQSPSPAGGDRSAGGENRYEAGVNIEMCREGGKKLHAIRSIVRGSTADMQGLLVGDLIVSIDNVPCSGLSTEQVEDRLRGPKDSVVRLRYERQERSRNHDHLSVGFVSLCRTIPVSSASHSQGSSSLSQEAKLAFQSLKEALERLQERATKVNNWLEWAFTVEGKFAGPIAARQIKVEIGSRMVASGKGSFSEKDLGYSRFSEFLQDAMAHGVVTVIWVENKVWVDTYGSRFVPPPAPIKVESKNICRHWQRGYCKDAAICPFTHDEICKHWQKCGHCPRGSKCAFLHQRH